MFDEVYCSPIIGVNGAIFHCYRADAIAVQHENSALKLVFPSAFSRLVAATIEIALERSLLQCSYCS